LSTGFPDLYTGYGFVRLSVEHRLEASKKVQGLFFAAVKGRMAGYDGIFGNALELFFTADVVIESIPLASTVLPLILGFLPLICILFLFDFSCRFHSALSIPRPGTRQLHHCAFSISHALEEFILHPAFSQPFIQPSSAYIITRPRI
jgi:hypothetical protein